MPNFEGGNLHTILDTTICITAVNVSDLSLFLYFLFPFMGESLITFIDKSD